MKVFFLKVKGRSKDNDNKADKEDALEIKGIENYIKEGKSLIKEVNYVRYSRKR